MTQWKVLSNESLLETISLTYWYMSYNSVKLRNKFYNNREYSFDIKNEYRYIASSSLAVTISSPHSIPSSTSSSFWIVWSRMNIRSWLKFVVVFLLGLDRHHQWMLLLLVHLVSLLVSVLGSASLDVCLRVSVGLGLRHEITLMMGAYVDTLLWMIGVVLHWYDCRSSSSRSG